LHQLVKSYIAFVDPRLVSAPRSTCHGSAVPSTDFPRSTTRCILVCNKGHGEARHTKLSGLAMVAVERTAVPCKWLKCR